MEIKFKSSPTILVVGDAMLDEYYYVNSNRISPEFPIPIMQLNSEVPALIRPGGAANILHQLSNFNAKCSLFSIVDYSGCVDLLRKKLDLCGSFMPYKSLMPRKKRYYNDGFPVFRLDVERYGYDLSNEDLIQARQIIYDKYNSKPADVIVLSDYNKGLFSEDLAWVRKDAITIVDPKTRPLYQWVGCTIFKPNKKEAFELSGYKDWKDQAKYFEEQLGCQAVAITQSENGVVGRCDGEYFEYKPKVTNFVPMNYMGAGDCFAAFLALSLGNKVDILESIKIACDISTIYVQKPHNELITKEDLLNPLERKFVEVDQLINRNYSLVFTNGCFDIFHAGHLNTLKTAKTFGDKLCVALNTDESVKKLKGNDRPVHILQQRKELIGSLEFVDYVVEFNEDTPLEIIKKLNPDVLVKGGDYASDAIVGKEYAKITKIVPFLENLSTTRILNIIENEF